MKKNKLKSKKIQNSKTMSLFAEYFDIIYHDKNYESEYKILLKIINEYGPSNAQKILDLGCGTGSHSLLFAKKGYDVTGIDLSSTAIELAKKKVKEFDLSANFLVKDMSNFSLQKKFDVCISMFSSMCYLNTIQFKKSLKNIKKHLNKNGLLIFDYWNGNAVVTEKPSTRIKDLNFKNKRIIRIATPSLNSLDQSCAIEYHCLIITENKIIDEFKETHTMRYYFPDELKNILEESGFKLISQNNPNSKKTKNSLTDEWYLTVVAKLN